MTWTLTDKLDALMRLGWTVTTEKDPDEGYLTARVAELPDAIATGDSEKELAIDAWEAIRASLSARLESGDEIPLPKGTLLLPWQRLSSPPRDLPAAEVTVIAHPLRVSYRTLGSGAHRGVAGQ